MSLATATKRPKVRVACEPRSVPRPPVVVCFVPELGDGADLIRVGADLAARLSADQVLVHVESAPLIAAEPKIAFASPQADARSQLREAARELARIAAAAGAREKTRIHAAFGDPESSLLEIAEREEAAFLLVGSRRFSSNLIERAPCPVLVIPDEPLLDALPPREERGHATVH
ncbi:MAG TPA: universal stress protein [Gaiellaceae bacterium]|nr:universal stress protein [Gaiellaceae bacterium]